MRWRIFFKTLTAVLAISSGFHRVHVDANLDRAHRSEFAEMPVSSNHHAYQLHRLGRIGIARDLHDARLRLVGEYERKLGIARAARNSGSMRRAASMCSSAVVLFPDASAPRAALRCD